MPMGMGFEIKVNNKDLVKALVAEVEQQTLEDWGGYAEGVAEQLCPVDTGMLRNTISHQVILPEHAVEMGTNLHYGVYVEYGTGKFAEETSYAKKIPWVYMDDNGNWHRTSGQHPQPFIRPAIANHTETYKQILYENMLNA